jgi:hypothetical protein
MYLTIFLASGKRGFYHTKFLQRIQDITRKAILRKRAKWLTLAPEPDHFVDINKMERRLISEQKKLLGRPEPLEQ